MAPYDYFGQPRCPQAIDQIIGRPHRDLSDRSPPPSGLEPTSGSSHELMPLREPETGNLEIFEL